MMNTEPLMLCMRCGAPVRLERVTRTMMQMDANGHALEQKADGYDSIVTEQLICSGCHKIFSLGVDYAYNDAGSFVFLQETEHPIEFLRCKCGEPLSLECAEIHAYHVSEDGECCIDNLTPEHAQRERHSEALVCGTCGRSYVEGQDWARDRRGRIRLLREEE